MKKTTLLTVLILLYSSLQVLSQTPTTVVVRAQSKDAKFIGTSMGGAYITITNADTGKILAEGVTSGSTGDTQKLVINPKRRGEPLSTPGAAKFEATLDLKEPVLVTISATGPLAQKQSQVTSTKQLWLIPGKNITGDGIILEIPGFAIDITAPRVHESVEPGKISIRANIVMMCGCPTANGGLWDSSEYQINAIIKRGEEKIDSVPLEFSGETSLFTGAFIPDREGTYEITVFAFHPSTGNTGVDKTTVTVTR